MGNSWRKFVLILFLALFLLQVVQSIVTTDDSACMQETGVNKMTTNKRSGGGAHGGSSSNGGGRSGGGEHGGSSGNSGGRGSDDNSNMPDGRLIPLVGGGLAGSRNGAATSRKRHNAASSTYSCSLPIALTATALEAVFLAL